MDALRYTKDIPGEPTPSDPVDARAQRGPGSAVAADDEETRAHVIDEDCEVCGSFLDEFEQGLKLCDFCAHEQAHCDDFEDDEP
jgi:hypothetical protein